MASASQIAFYRKHPERAPLTRRELLWYVWQYVQDVNIFKEGRHYAIRVGRRIAATHVRNLNQCTKAQWMDKVRDVAAGYAI